MNSVALPALSTAPGLGAEGDLARQASGADRAAFHELYRRHSQTAWRLAYATAADKEMAARAVSEGFVQVLRDIRRRPGSPSAADFRPVLLTAVYTSALDQIRRQAAAASTSTPTSNAGRRQSTNPDTAMASAALRSLPERWRAALWLSEVEGMTMERLAPILGVSAAVASLLVSRGRRGMVSRYGQAGVDLPDHLGAALRPLAATVPDGLAATVATRWHKAAGAPTGGRYAPTAGWLGEHTTRPLAAACGGLLALSVVGLGVLGLRSTVPRGTPVSASAAPTPTGSVGVNPFGFSNAGSPASQLLVGLGGSDPGAAGTASSRGFDNGSATSAGTSTSYGAPATSSGPPAGTGGSTSGAPSAPSGSGGSPAAGVGSTDAGGPTTTPGTVAPTIPGTPSLPTIAAPVALSSTPAGATVAVGVPTASQPLAQVNAGCSTGVGLNVAGIAVQCQTPAPSTTVPAAPTTSTTNVVSGLVGGVSGIVPGLLGK